MPPENEQQIDLSQLFAEVSRTVNGIKTMISPGEAGTLADSPISNIISGNVCFKACGMEDIQFAARVISFITQHCNILDLLYHLHRCI